jgi:hypothetical protein
MTVRKGKPMAYSEFTIPTLRRLFGLRIGEDVDYFSSIPASPVSAHFQEGFEEKVRFAREVNTEKARSEFIIAPVLWEVRHQLLGRVSLFTGVEFNVDSGGGLRGVCDYLLSLSPLQFALEAPVVAIVEAKRENIPGGIAQCLAEMVAAQLFNNESEKPIAAVYGAVTTGTDWRFLRLENKDATVDRVEYHIDEVDRIVGILVWMVVTASGGDVSRNT